MMTKVNPETYIFDQDKSGQLLPLLTLQSRTETYQFRTETYHFQTETYRYRTETQHAQTETYYFQHG